MPNRVTVLGNGESRKGIDLESLRKEGPIYGCNALHRDFSPDVLCATDWDMIFEIMTSGYTNQHQCFLNYGDTFPIDITQGMDFDGYEIREGDTGHRDRCAVFGREIPEKVLFKIWMGNDDMSLPYPHSEKSTNTGPFAVRLACENELPDEVHLYGFDIYGIDGKHNNVYKDTECYAKSDQPATTQHNWIEELRKVFLDFPEITFYHINPINTTEEWNAIPNLQIRSECVL